MTIPPQIRPGAAATSPNPQRRALEAASEPVLARVIERARWLAGLDALLRQSLPATLAGQVKLANVDENHLVFLAASPVWKAKLRHCGHLVEAAATAAGLAPRTLLVKVSPEVAAPIGAQHHGKPLSEAARTSLRATALSLADPDLRAQLLRLASLS